MATRRGLLTITACAAAFLIVRPAATVIHCGHPGNTPAPPLAQIRGEGAEASLWNTLVREADSPWVATVRAVTVESGGREA